ncbi:MAG: helix-turn-helix domain-containing protein [Clostridia bacterium]|nr:helix-turn-helix domain-containing protein [Clostridia bacterium]
MSIENMTKNMVALRTMLHLSQAELADLIGVGRQTLVAIETRKRKMTWNTFLSLLFVFTQNKETNSLLGVFGIYTAELKYKYSDITSQDTCV